MATKVFFTLEAVVTSALVDFSLQQKRLLLLEVKYISKFTLPGHEHPLQLRGKVVRVHRDTRNRANMSTPGMNVRFVQMTRQTEDDLNGYLVPCVRQHVIRQLAERRMASKQAI